MEIVNTISGVPITDVSAWMLILLMLGIGVGMGMIFLSIDNTIPVIMFLFGLILVVASMICLAQGGHIRETGELTPTKYEVLLREGAIIDATKYEIIEKRGKIYVIQEREVSAE